jgi:tRNA-(ms[2]io[6]A)-hydroxylase
MGFAVDFAAVLHLASQTSASWLERARTHLDDVLLDHAHCEKKAAGAAVKLLFSYPHHRFLQEPLAALAREELVHFEQVLARLDARGIPYRTIRPGPYGMALHALTRGDEPGRLVDMLLVSALIEARSCERFTLLADAIEDEELACFYRSLVASEARHHGIYLDLAGRLVDRESLDARLTELAQREAEIVERPCEWVRMHAG